MELGGHAFQCTGVRFLALTDDQLLLAHFNNCVGWALPTILVGRTQRLSVQTGSKDRTTSARETPYPHPY